MVYVTGDGIANMLGAGTLEMIMEYAAIATDSREVEDLFSGMGKLQINFNIIEP